MGDALAVALLEARGFSEEDFAFSHPGGMLGRRLLLKVEDIMHTGDQIPHVAKGTLLSAALLEISEKGLGMTAVLDDQSTLIGLFTDGDLRRTLDKGIDVRTTKIEDVMTRHCKTTTANILAAQALTIMEQNKISGILVVDDGNKVVGALHMHDLLRAGVI
jgi:arabinose-5-phosphate isomerase